MTEARIAADVQQIINWLRNPYESSSDRSKPYLVADKLEAALIAGEAEAPAVCVCGHAADEHGNDGAGHCGASKNCRAGGCEKFRPVGEAPAPRPIVHVYISTACQHELHDRCRQRCKFCAVACRCACHGKLEEAAPRPIVDPDRCESRGPDGFRCTLPQGHRDSHTAIPETYRSVAAPRPIAPLEEYFCVAHGPPFDDCPCCAAVHERQRAEAAEQQIAALTHCVVCDLRWSGPWTDCPGCQTIAGMQALAGDAIPNAVAVELAGQANALQAMVVELTEKLSKYEDSEV